MCRLLLSGIRKEQWPGYIDEIFRICKPGNGWAQVIEACAYRQCDDGTVPETAAINTVLSPLPMTKFLQFNRWLKEHYEIGQRLELTPDHIIERLQRAGFIDLSIRRFKLHIGEWGDDERSRNSGRLGALVVSESAGPLMEGMSQFILDNEERTAFVRRVEEEMKDPELHLYMPLYSPFGGLADL